MQYNLGARKDEAQEGLGLLYTPYTGDKGLVLNLTDSLSNDAFKDPLWICKVRNLSRKLPSYGRPSGTIVLLHKMSS